MSEKFAIQFLSLKLTIVLLVVFTFFIYSVYAENTSIINPNFKLTTIIDAEGIITDVSDNIDSEYDFLFEESIDNKIIKPYITTHYKDSIMTSGGRVLANKEFEPSSIEKVLTYKANQSGHLITNNHVSDTTDSSYESDLCEAEGYTLLNKTGNIETKITKPGNGEFFHYTVSPLKNEGEEDIFATVDTNLHYRNDIPQIEQVWDFFLFDLFFYSEPGKISQNTILNDHTLSSGDLSFYEKKYSYENYGISNNTTTDYGDLCVFREWIMKKDSGVNF